MRKKMILYLICFVILFLLLINYFGRDNYKEYDEYCYKINNILIDYDFQKACLEENCIVLYDDEDVQIDRMEFNYYNKNLEILYIRKDGNRIYFVLKASLDDEKGILFINDSSNSTMDGIVKLNRLNGNSYMYSSY